MFTIYGIIHDVVNIAERTDYLSTLEQVQEIMERYSTKREVKILPFTQHLSPEFLAPYIESGAGMQPLGQFVYYRTYSRWLEEQGRREEWHETVKRAVEYNCALAEAGIEEMELLFNHIYNMDMFLSGRTFWVGGTPVASKFPSANFNCSFLVARAIRNFTDLMYLLLVGSGVGFRVLPEDVAQLPKFSTDVSLSHTKYVRARVKQDETGYLLEDGNLTVIVGDSKEGWAQSLGVYMLALSGAFGIVKSIYINYDYVRPKGERLKHFGGTASGHESLKTMFTKIHKVICASDGGILKDIDALDIGNIIGENVVSGGVRRTSEMCLFAKGSLITEAKTNMYDKDNNYKLNQDIAHRQFSNNAIGHFTKPREEELHQQFLSMRYSGEPSWVNMEAGKKRFSAFEGVNPCVEILLPPDGMCNLVTVNVKNCISSKGILDMLKLNVLMKLATRASMRMTLVELELPEFNENLKKHRQIGVSVTGWQDMVNATGMDKESQAYVLKRMKKAVKDEAKHYATILGIDEPVTATTVKPEGSLSQLPVVSSGVHYSHSPYFIRRVRCTKVDPVAQAGIALGWSVHPEVGQDWDTCNTVVFEFPVKAPEGRTKYDVSAIEQLENYKMFMENYVEHNVSITVHVRDHEWAEVEKWVWDNWDSCVAISFLPLDDSFYELLPYEAITKAEYEKRVAEMKPLDISLITQFENGLDVELLESGCEGGICPIR